MAKILVYAFDYMCEDELCSTVYVYDDDSVKVINHTNIIVKLPFGNWSDEVELKDVEDFFSNKMFP